MFVSDSCLDLIYYIMDSYYEENNQLGALQTAVNSAPENPLHYLKFFDYLKSSDSSEVS